MKLETLKTIESALTGAISAEKAKVDVAREKLENASRDALKKPEIGRGKEIPVRRFNKERVDAGAALSIVEETFALTESDEVKAECERLFELFRECSRKENEADNRISELRAALKDFSSISWRE